MVAVVLWITNALKLPESHLDMLADNTLDEEYNLFFAWELINVIFKIYKSHGEPK